MPLKLPERTRSMSTTHQFLAKLMQDFQAFSGRLMGYQAAAAAAAAIQQQQQPVKCPRCDSTNTKFCYYNNYNLSQPRHFCRSCRRYWTKGGVLRNVPVGGRCRNSKRPSSSSEPPNAVKDKDHSRRSRPSSSASQCIRNRSRLTAAASSPVPFPDPTLLAFQISTSNPNPPLESSLPADTHLCPVPDVLQDLTVGSFTPAILGRSFPDPSPGQEKAAAELIRSGFVDQTVPTDPGPGGGGGGIPALDWSAAVGPSLLQPITAVDPLAYWNQSRWFDAYPTLYLP